MKYLRISCIVFWSSSAPSPSPPIPLPITTRLWALVLYFSSWVFGHPLTCARLNRGHTHKVTSFPSPEAISHQPLLSQGWRFMSTFPLHAGVLPGLTLRVSCACCHNCWVHLCNCPSASIKQFLCDHPLPLAVRLLLFPLPKFFQSLGRKRCVTDVSFAAENSASFYSLHLENSQVPVLVVAGCKNKVIWRGMKDTLIWAYGEGS